MGNRIANCKCCYPTKTVKIKQFEKEAVLQDDAKKNVIGREVIVKNNSIYKLMVRVSSHRISSISNKNDRSFERQYSKSASIGSSGLANISASFSNQHSDKDLVERSITFSNDDIINQEFIPIKMYSQRKYDGGYSSCYLSAYYIEENESNDDINGTNNDRQVWICQNWNVSPKENIFVFDGKEINSEIHKNYTSNGKYYIITVFDGERSLNAKRKGNKVTVPIEIYWLGHTENEQFNFHPCHNNRNYCNVKNLASSLFWEINKNNQLIQSKDNQEISQQFQFELIAHSTTYRIKSRQNGLYLTVDGNILSMNKWNERDPNQRFILEPHK